MNTVTLTGRYYNGDRYNAQCHSAKHIAELMSLIYRGARMKNAIKAFPQNYVDPESLKVIEDE